MKKALDAAGIQKHLMVQPLGYLTPDASKQGFIDLPEFPFGKFVPGNLVNKIMISCCNFFSVVFKQVFLNEMILSRTGSKRVVAVKHCGMLNLL